MKCIRVWISTLLRMIAQVLAGTSLIQFAEKDHHLKMQLTLTLYSVTSIQSNLYFYIKSYWSMGSEFPRTWLLNEKRRLMSELVSLIYGMNLKIKLLDNCRGFRGSEDWMKMLWSLVLRDNKKCVKIWIKYFKFCI